MMLYVIIGVLVLLGVTLGFLLGRASKKKSVLEQLVSRLSLEQKFFLAFALVASGFILKALKEDFSGSAGPYKFSLVLATLLLLFVGFVYLSWIQQRKAARATVSVRRRGGP